MDIFRGVGFLFLLLTIIFLQSCGSDEQVVQERPLIIRIPSEPDNLHPFYSKSSYSTSIENLIFLPLADYNVKGTDLVPLLIEEIPRPDTLKEGPYAGGLQFPFTLREGVQWADGTPMTVNDYVFTVKSAVNRHNQAHVYRSYLSFIKEITPDPSNPRKFTVTVPDPYILSEIVVCNFYILPAHIYDPEGVYENYSLEELLNMDETPLEAGRDSLLKAYSEGFTDLNKFRSGLIGTGAYTLSDWVTGEYLRLERVEDWWADGIGKNRPELLHAYPATIEYRVIPDETTALAALQENSIDLISEVTPRDFLRMKEDPQLKDEFAFYTVSLMQYHCLELNNKIPELSDRQVRLALAHTIDYETAMENLTMGLAERVVGPFHHVKSYYNNDLEPIRFNLEEARQLLASAGWTDSNGNGTVDKEIDGKRQEIELDVMVTQKEEGQQLALMIKENAEKVGIGINIVTVDGTKLVQEYRARNFEVLPLKRRSDPGPEDPYQYWNSASDSPNGGNRSGFRDAEADSITEQIRVTMDDKKRDQLFRALQVEIYEEQPVIFLYSPLEKIIVNKDYAFETSPRRPGYFENLMKLKQ